MDIALVTPALAAANNGNRRRAHPKRPLVVVLTGTDLYHDIDHSPEAQRSLGPADRLVVLQPLGVQRLPAALRGEAVVIVQSSPALAPRPKTRRHLRALKVGHLRDEKQPQTLFDAARLLQGRPDVRIDHVGAALDPALGTRTAALAAVLPGYRWLGVLVHPSRLEAGSACGLAALLQRCRDEPAMLDHLVQQCAQRAAAFAPQAERAALLAMITDLETTRA